MTTVTIDTAFSAFDQAEADIFDAIRAANIAVGRRLPAEPYQRALAKARARMDAAVRMIEASGRPAPMPFGGMPGYGYTKARPGGAVDRGRPANAVKEGRYQLPVG